MSAPYALNNETLVLPWLSLCLTLSLAPLATVRAAELWLPIFLAINQVKVAALSLLWNCFIFCGALRAGRKSEGTKTEARGGRGIPSPLWPGPTPLALTPSPPGPDKHRIEWYSGQSPYPLPKSYTNPRLHRLVKWDVSNFPSCAIYCFSKNQGVMLGMRKCVNLNAFEMLLSSVSAVSCFPSRNTMEDANEERRWWWQMAMRRVKRPSYQLGANISLCADFFAVWDGQLGDFRTSIYWWVTFTSCSVNPYAPTSA